MFILLLLNHDSNQMQIGPDKAGAHLRFNSGDGAEAARIDSSKRLLVGQTSTSAASTLLLENNSLGTSRQGILLLAASRQHQAMVTL